MSELTPPRSPLPVNGEGEQDERYTKILARLAAARKSAGLSQSQLGKLLGGYSSSFICDIEKGRNPLPVDRLLKICDLCLVSVEWVMTGINPNFDDVKRQEVIDAVKRNGKIAADDLHRLLDDLEMWS